MIRGKTKKKRRNFRPSLSKIEFLFEKLPYFRAKQYFICSFSFHLLILMNKGTKFFKNQGIFKATLFITKI